MQENKKVLFLDIETLPADESDSATMEKLKHLYDKKPEKTKSGNDKISWRDYFLNTSFDGGFGRILCIALAVNEGEVKCYVNDKNEKKTLEQFWEVARQCDFFIGHNIIEFDMRFIWQRSIALGVKPSWQDADNRSPKYLSFAKYKNFPMFDIMHEWTKWGRDNLSLEHLALSLGVPSPKDGIDGSQVYDFYKKGEIDKICEYCKKDVETVRAIYKKMIFR